MVTVRRGLLLVFVVLLVLLVAAGAALAQKPTKVVIITMDQMKPWYAQAYDMTNILWLEKHGANFKRATVGQMASETVVSHNTIVSGQLPKHMGWSDEVTRLVRPLMKVDANGQPTGEFYPAGSIVTVGDLSYLQYQQLIEDLGYPKLGDYMHKAFPGSVVANLGGKYYQVASTAASSSDFWVTYGSKKKTVDLPDPAVLPWIGTYRGPDPNGKVPSYILDDNRFMISTGNHAALGNDYYNTDVDKPAYLYPEDGRMVPGPYDTNLGGDDWVADAAAKVIANEDWSALHLNFSGIDKIGHMWGGGSVDTLANYGWDPDSLMKEVHMPWIAKNADDQVGKVIAALKASGDWNSTLFVVLADHGATNAENAHYVDASGGGNLSWYYDPNNQCVNTTYGRAGANNAAVLGPLNATGNLAYSYQSTAIEAWLIDNSWAKKMESAAVMKTMPDVIATYVRMGDKYKLVAKGAMTRSEHKWWASHAQQIVNTMAFDGAADVVGLLADHTSYGVYGDHGGAQREVQRIPMVMYAKGMQHISSGAPFHLVDVLPTVLRSMGIKQMAPMDGKAYNLPLTGAKCKTRH
jgi:Type I phosphodiesterase / nucleotide pyrophosphatase